MAGTQSVQTPATIASTHQMLVALAIFAGVGMLLVIIADDDDNAGKLIAGVLAIMLVVQGITRVNPLVAFLSNHPLIPTVPVNPNIAAGTARKGAGTTT